MHLIFFLVGQGKKVDLGHLSIVGICVSSKTLILRRIQIETVGKPIIPSVATT